MKIAFATTLMNREADLKKTLPANLEVLKEHPDMSITLLNYNSNGDLSEWIQSYLENQQLNYFEEREAAYFSMSRAKNLSVLLSDAEFVVNLDADNFLDKDFLSQTLRAVNAGAEYIVPLLSNKNCGIDGRIGFLKSIFIQERGYDELMQGWGFEDSDLLARLAKAHKKRGHILFNNYNVAIRQTDEEKVVNYQDADKDRMFTGRRNYALAQKENRIINPDGFALGTIYDKNNKQIILKK